MNEDGFLGVLRQGRGRAMLMLREHGAAACREGLLHASLHDLRYDGQCEGSRVDYVFELLEAAGDTAAYRDAVLQGADGDPEKRDAEHLMGLCRRFAQTGDSEARDALYRHFHRLADEGTLEYADDIVLLDGLAGLLVAADRLRVLPDAAEEIWQLGWWIDHLGERVGKEQAWAQVEAAAEEHEWLRPMLVAVREEEARCAERRGAYSRVQMPPYDELRRRILAGDKWCYPMRMGHWGRRASEDDLSRAAADLLLPMEPKQRDAYVGIFTMRAFPGDPAPLIELARHPDRDTWWWATRALGNVAHPAVREFAMELDCDPERCPEAVLLLKHNLREGDDAYIEGLLRRDIGQWEVHRAGGWLRDVAEANPDADLSAPLATLMEVGPCSNCRLWSAELLQARGTLPAWFLEEAPYDANPRVREMVAG